MCATLCRASLLPTCVEVFPACGIYTLEGWVGPGLQPVDGSHLHHLEFGILLALTDYKVLVLPILMFCELTSWEESINNVVILGRSKVLTFHQKLNKIVDMKCPLTKTFFIQKYMK